MNTKLIAIFKTISKNITLKNLLVGLVVVIVVSSAKHFIFGGFTCTLSFYSSISLGFLALITRLASTGLVEYLIDYYNLANSIINLLDYNKVTITGTTSYHMNANPAPNRPNLTVVIPGSTGTGNVAGGNAPGGANPLPANGRHIWGDGFSEWGNPNQPVGNRINGPLQINDPDSQAYNGYKSEGTNQPFARNLAMALEHQFTTSKSSSISRYALSLSHQTFIAYYLRQHRKDLYNRVVTETPTGDIQSIEIWKLPNTVDLRLSISDLI